MKLLCSVSTGNRSALGLKNTHIKSTLALCKHPKVQEYCIILFTAKDKTGIKYNIKDNVLKVFTRFVNEGKCTVQFKEPPHDLFVQADVIQLKTFLHLFKRAIENKIGEKEMTCSSLSVMPLSAKNVPPTKLCIKNRSEYPIKGFPRTLEILHINDVQRCSLDRGILNLKRLKVLNLSFNCIECLPVEINELPCLSELNMEHNALGKSSPKKWEWMGGNFSKTLKVLNLSSNNLRFLPNEVVKLHKLTTFYVDNNQLKSLPSCIGTLKDLQLFSAAKNSLSSLPGSVRMWHLEHLDLSQNKFNAEARNDFELASSMSVCSLKECSSKVILVNRLIYNEKIVPRTVVKYLDNAKYCLCGKACFDVFVTDKSSVRLSYVAKNVKMSACDSMRVTVNNYCCSLSCVRSAKTCAAVRHFII